jgi:hypothetical protein
VSQLVSYAVQCEPRPIAFLPTVCKGNSSQSTVVKHVALAQMDGHTG